MTNKGKVETDRQTDRQRSLEENDKLMEGGGREKESLNRREKGERDRE